MADATRFPQLALPFAVVGGAAGWLSATFLGNPAVHLLPWGLHGLTAGLAAALAAATGALLTRWCVGRRYAYQLDALDPNARLATDTWPRHLGAVLVAGAATGATLPLVYLAYAEIPLGMLGGALCALAFFPVCAAVIAAARRAQRARLGSLVAGSDRRAVWGILGATLSVTTLAGLLEWPAAAAGYHVLPAVPLAMALATGALVLALLGADVRALVRARRALVPGLAPRSEAELGAADAGLARLDLGLGDELLARVAPSASAYRARERTLALVLGHPGRAEAALRRAVRRGVLSLAVIGAVIVAHLSADSEPALALYEARWCDSGDLRACRRAAELVEERDPARAMALYEHGCESSVGLDCARIAQISLRGHGLPIDAGRALRYHHLACEAGWAESCRHAAALLVMLGEPLVGDRSAPALRARGCMLGDAASCDHGPVDDESWRK